VSKLRITPDPGSTTVQSLWKWAISSAIVFHFSVIVLTYATNSRRSAIQDQALVFLQPYLIGGNWYQEMLPIEWVAGDSSHGSISISVQTMDAPNRWKPILESREPASRSILSDQIKTRRLLQLAVKLHENDDPEAILRILHSVVLHLDSPGTNSKLDPSRLVTHIRLEQATNEKISTEIEPDDATPATIFEASVARFESGEIGLIPKIEDRRSVRAKEAVRGRP